MNPLLSIGVFNHGDGEEPVILAMVTNLTAFNMFTRITAHQSVIFGARTVAGRTMPGVTHSVEMKDMPYIVHARTRSDGLCGIVVADQTYDVRVAHTLLRRAMEDYERSKNDWKAVNADCQEEPQFLKDYLIRYQDPKKGDDLLKIQNTLSEITDIMHTNIDEILKRGENLDKLIERTDDLSTASKIFVNKTKTLNRHCPCAIM